MMKIFITFSTLVTLALADSLPEDDQRSSITTPKDLNAKAIDARIVNGEQATAGQYPWQAAIYFEVNGQTSFCGGSLIHQRWILTAAHCAKGASKFKIVLGSIKNDLNFNPGAVIIETKVAIVHDKYNENNLNNDVALIKLPKPVNLTDKIKTIALPKKNDYTKSDVDVTVIGWGKTGDVAPGSNKLLYTQLKTISNKVCEIYFEKGIVITETLCAKGTNGRSTCNGDSGGSLITFNSDNEAVHTGIVSFVSIKGCHTDAPTGYARTASYREWIDKHTNGANRMESVYVITVIVGLLFNKTLL